MLLAQGEVIDKLQENWIYGAIGLGVLVALIVLVKIATGRKRPHPDLEKGQREYLAEYPPPPPAGIKRLSVNGERVRLRLVVVVQSGRAQERISLNDVPELLNAVVRGLGEFINFDKPRVKVWPAQLSVTGFAPTFHRLVVSPDADQEQSQWVKLAGSARIGNRPILLGMAFHADEPTRIGDVHVDPREWNDLLRIER
jgi:hypothetical protein